VGVLACVKRSYNKPAQIEEVANYSHENQTPEPFFERMCFQCRSDGRDSHGENSGEGGAPFRYGMVLGDTTQPYSSMLYH